MALKRSRNIDRSANIWPGFVDALSSLLLVFIFVMALFSIASFYLGQRLSDTSSNLDKTEQERLQFQKQVNILKQELDKLDEKHINLVNSLTAVLQTDGEDKDEILAKINELIEEKLNLQKDLDNLQVEFDNLVTKQINIIKALNEALGINQTNVSAESDLSRQLTQVKQLKIQLEELQTSKELLLSEVTSLQEDKSALQQVNKELQAGSENNEVLQKKISEQELELADNYKQLQVLQEQISALQKQMQRIQNALNAKDDTLSKKDIEINELTQKLQAALLDENEQLRQYQSRFFAELKKAIGDNEDIKVVGDRFIIPSSVIFSSGNADIGRSGVQAIEKIAKIITNIQADISSDIAWIIRVEGHTDKRPVAARSEFKDNWRLSSARAQNVVDILIRNGVDPKRLMAAGMGEYHPIDTADNPQAYAKNRRIEIKLTNR